MARVFGQIYGKCFKVDLLSLLKFAVKTVEVYYTVYLYIYIYIFIYFTTNIHSFFSHRASGVLLVS